MGGGYIDTGVDLVRGGGHTFHISLFTIYQFRVCRWANFPLQPRPHPRPLGFTIVSSLFYIRHQGS